VESPARPSQHHIALTVTDLDASIDWYSKVFGIALQMEGPHEGGYMKLLADETFQFVIVLHRHDANEQELFAESRTGLDHLGMGVASRADLVAWQDHLEANGVVRSEMANKPLTQSPIADEDYGSVLVFRDPDNIQLELFAPPSQ
jgi:catechol 2,3-dioxygenase-like lactoylglutathione lyase family enzyme